MAQMDTTATSATDAQAAVKTRAACDECRLKKLKCTGERPSCFRCVREKISCVYSPQKQMGRPRKRQRVDGEEEDEGAAVAAVAAAGEAVAGMEGANGDSGHTLAEQVTMRGLGALDASSGEQAWNANDTSGGAATAATASGTDDWVPLNANGRDDGEFDMAAFDSAFTPGGSVQPWLRVGNFADVASGGAGGDVGIGGQRKEGQDDANYHAAWDVPMGSLTPDNGSTESSPPLNGTRVPDHTHQHQHQHHQHQHNHGGTTMTAPTAPGQDGSVVPSYGSLASPLPSCACLSTMYLTLTELQGMNPAFTFPFTLHPLRNALQVTSEVIACEQCPTRFITAIQNTQLIGTMLVALAERFSKVLEAINAESTRAEAAHETKKFRLTDLNTATSHLHLGGLKCHAAFNLDVSPAEWRSMAKKVVKAEVHGTSSDDGGEGEQCCPSLTTLMRLMEERQMRWHQMPLVSDFPRHPNGQAVGRPHNMKREDHVCLKMVGYANVLVSAFDWS